MKTAKLISIFLASLFIIFSAPTKSVLPAQASTGCGVFCPNYYVSSVEPPGELSLAEATTEYIAYFLDYQYDDVYVYMNEDATAAAYNNTIGTLADSYDEAAFFSKGHRNLRTLVYPGDSIGLYDHTGGQDPVHTTWDTTISQLSEGGNFKFVFLWHCSTAELYKDIPDTKYYGYLYPGGLPLAFTNDWDMELYGDADDHTFIGWVDGSPNFIADYPDTWNGYYNYAHFAYYFFEAYS